MNAAKPTLDQAFEQAVAYHRNGQLSEAERLYRAVIGFDAGHIHALHLLGVLLQHRGRHEEGFALMREAISRNPRYTEAHINLGVALASRQRHEEAAASYRNALEIKPDLAPVHCSLGTELGALGRRQEAVASYRQAIALDPGYADAHYSLGTVLGELGRHEEAMASYKNALSLQPGHAGAHNGLGFALSMLKRPEDAVACYRTAIALQPEFAEAHNNLGTAMNDGNRHEEALSCARRALELEPGYAEAYNNAGRALAGLGRLGEATANYEKALAIAPSYADACYNLAIALNALDRHEEAIEIYRKGLGLKPGVAEAHNNLGATLSEVGRYQEAVMHHRQAVAIKPGFAEAHCNLGFGLLTLGEYAQGWPELEWRWGTEDVGQPQKYAQPQWSGKEDLSGKTVLLHCEQGFGDTLQFVRYAPLVAAAGARVIVAVQPQLKALISGMAGADAVITRGDPLPAFDFHCPLLSLPLALGTTLQNIPAGVPYLHPPADRVEKWRAILGPSAAPRIGLVWLTRREHKNDRNRSISLPRLLPLLRVPGVRFVSLQKDLREGDAGTLGEHPEILHVGERLGDFADTAAVVSLLDLVISVDTSAVHLTGALGKPVWAMLPFSADWRWHVDRDDSPWYPTARLFRQPRAGDWDSVIERVRQQLAAGPAGSMRSRAANAAIQAGPGPTLDEALRFQREGRLDEAEKLCRAILNADRDHVEALHLLGVLRAQRGRPDEAVELIGAAIGNRPGDADAYNNLGAALNDLKRYEEAAGSFREALAIDPDMAEAHSNLGNALNALGRSEEAIASYDKALALNPEVAEVHNNLGSALNDLGRHEEAVASYLRAVALRPDFAEAHSNLGTSLSALNRFEPAIASYRKALAIKPDYAGACNNLGSALLKVDRAAEASSAWRRALEIRPDYHEAHSGLIGALGFDPAADLQAHLAERRRWEEQQVRGRGIVALSGHGNRPDPERKLRVGYVSADFRWHAAATAFGPALLDYDRSRFDVICYSNHVDEDPTTARFRNAVSGWRAIFGVPDERVAEMIRADAIDILVDLSGHTVGNRLLAFAHRPAPVQVTAWGHATGTGLSAIDYLFSDATTIPEAWQRFYAENVVYLPCFMAYVPLAPAPPVTALPARAAGHVTFGYFNNYNKLSEAALGLWGRLLAEVPESRLLLKAREFAAPEPRERVLRALARSEVEPARILFEGVTPWEEHMAAVGRADIALDPFPCAGGVSTMEALWMGVPLVTLKGDWVLHRGSAAILSAAGLADWIAGTPQQYLEIAVRKARAVHALEPLRQGLRGALLATPIGNPALYMRAVEAAYREMWRRWCS